MKEIKKAEIQAVTDGGLPFSLRLTRSGSWEAKITVITTTGTPLVYFYSAPTLNGIQAFIEGVEQSAEKNLVSAPLIRG